MEYVKWRRRGSNPQPPGCKPGALPIELRPQSFFHHQPASTTPALSVFLRIHEFPCFFAFLAEFSDKSDTSLIADCFILTIQPATVKFGQPKVALAAEVGVRQAAPAEIANEGVPV